MEIVSVNSSSVTLQWMPPQSPNGVITHYSIQLNGTDYGNFSSNELMYTVEGLSPDTVYVLQLRAHTVVGAGPSTIESVLTRKLLHIMQNIVHTVSSLIVTGFWKTNPNRTFDISRITNLKYLTHCGFLLLGCSYAKLGV